MAPLRCCSFNCRGWRSDISTLKDHIDSLDLCFVQEHWLHNDHLNKINDISSDFLSVSISGMNSGSLLCGRPYGGYAILYRKSLSSCITPSTTLLCDFMNELDLCACDLLYRSSVNFTDERGDGACAILD